MNQLANTLIVAIAIGLIARQLPDGFWLFGFAVAAIMWAALGGYWAYLRLTDQD
jgi:hypothetical protein